MKIEKLTENKIRVIINSNELDIDDNVSMSEIMESQNIFLDILKKAEEEVAFHTDGCKLLIEFFSSIDDFFVFTITKYIPNKTNIKNKPIVKKKTFSKVNAHAICHFEDFDSFCEFCNAIKIFYQVHKNTLINNSALYLWKDSYYLVLKNINIKSENSYFLYSMLSEFAKIISFSDSFEAKLLEYGKVLMKKDAINIGINLFTD